MYQAIYRKYRPDTFDKVLGQDEIVEVLKNQVNNQQLSHAYIFSGGRGTGKTSCAKILARAVNCLNPQNGSPCNECENCKKILDNMTMDVVEMDAASNRRIDDIRDLRDKVIYPPSSLKYKVYIIDEAHMITNEGFNALLKIMEEPPDHLIFILATTELDKIPITIQSRCQRFDFERLERDSIEESLKYIVKDLGLEIEEEALKMISRAASGAMRDAQSILDQVISAADGIITSEITSRTIGQASTDQLVGIVDRIIAKDLEASVGFLKTSLDQVGPGEFISSILDYYNSLMLYKAKAKSVDDLDLEVRDKVLSQVESFSMGGLIDSISIIMSFLEKTKYSDSQESLAYMLVAKLIDQEDRKALISRIRSLEERLDALEKNGPIVNRRQQAVPRIEPVVEREIVARPIETSPQKLEKAEEVEEKVEDTKPENLESTKLEETSPKDRSFTIDDILDEWGSFTGQVLRDYGTWGFWLDNIRPESLNSSTLSLRFPEGQDILKTFFMKEKEAFTDELSKFYGKALNVEIASELVKEEDDLNKLKSIFGDKLQIK